VARLLIERGHRVRALVRPSSHLVELDAEPVPGDLRDADSLARAVAGCGAVFHVAADYRLWARNPQDLYRSNVDGTRNMLRAAREAGADRVVYTSTVGCIGLPADGVGDEDTPVSVEDMAGDYKRSKFLAEEIAREEMRAGCPVVIVNPTTPVGDHDFKPTPTGKIILDYISARMPAYLDTGLNFVDVSDVARGHLQALETGRVGERYILGCENLTLRQFFLRLEQISGVRAPGVRIPYAVAYGAGVLSTGWASVTGREPRVPLDAVRMAKKKMFVCHDKAQRELGYRPGPLDSAFTRAIEWFRRKD
jgi:dihydroflavonol-4-reductase